jgi:hypothetical protein
VNRICFLLSHPRHCLDKNLLEHFLFYNARISKDTGKIAISREYHNGECGGKFATLWETTNVSAENFYGNIVTIYNLNDPLVSKMNTWNEGHPDDRYGDTIILDRSLGLKAHVYLPPEQFARLVGINWTERFLNLTLNTKQSLEGLKLELAVEEKNALREGKKDYYLHGIDELKIEVTNYEIEIGELPNTMMKQSRDSTKLHVLTRLFRFVSGR